MFNFFTATTTAQTFMASIGNAVGSQFDSSYVFIATVMGAGILFWLWSKFQARTPGHRGR